MDLRVIGGGAAALAFGAGGYNYVSVDEVLSAEVRHVSTVPAAELESYMKSVVGEMADAYDYYGFETDTYVFVGNIEFKADAKTRTFSENVRSEDAVSAEDRRMIAADIKSWDFCGSDDATLFTEKGYNYSVDFRDGKGTRIHYIKCDAAESQLRS